MEKDELVKHVELELQWLRYYANEPSRMAFDPSMSPYSQLVSIGYAKRYFPLQYRCVFARMTASTPIKDTPLENITLTGDPRSPENNVLSALEVFMLKFPDEHDWVTKSLQ
jgi:hypothetical protein